MNGERDSRDVRYCLWDPTTVVTARMVALGSAAARVRLGVRCITTSFGTLFRQRFISFRLVLPSSGCSLACCSAACVGTGVGGGSMEGEGHRVLLGNAGPIGSEGIGVP